MFGDLLNDYLNYFLPINERDVNFPASIDSNKIKEPLSTSSPIHPQRRHQPSLFKRVIQKSLINTDDLSMIGETSDRIGDMRKIDLFLRLINEFLIYPFTDMSTGQTQNLKFSQDFKSSSFISPITNFNSPQISSSSPLKYNDPIQYLTNLEIVFALSMVLKHSHFFCDAFPIDSNPTFGK